MKHFPTIQTLWGFFVIYMEVILEINLLISTFVKTVVKNK